MRAGLFQRSFYMCGKVLLSHSMQWNETLSISRPSDLRFCWYSASDIRAKTGCVHDHVPSWSCHRRPNLWHHYFGSSGELRNFETKLGKIVHKDSLGTVLSAACIKSIQKGSVTTPSRYCTGIEPKEVKICKRSFVGMLLLRGEHQSSGPVAMFRN